MPRLKKLHKKSRQSGLGATLTQPYTVLDHGDGIARHMVHLTTLVKAGMSPRAHASEIDLKNEVTDADAVRHLLLLVPPNTP